MTPVTRNKLLWVMVTLALGVFVVGAWTLLDLPAWTLFVFATLLLIRGRVSAVVLRDLYRSSRLIDAERYEEAIDTAERFLRVLEVQPWRRSRLFIPWAFYTWNTEAMARNNLAAAHIELGNLDSAEVQLKKAISLDPQFPIPYHNLASLQAGRGAEAEAERLLTVAAEKGFKQSLDDRVIAKVSKAYAALQSAPLR